MSGQQQRSAGDQLPATDAPEVSLFAPHRGADEAAPSVAWPGSPPLLSPYAPPAPSSPRLGLEVLGFPVLVVILGVLLGFIVVLGLVAAGVPAPWAPAEAPLAPAPTAPASDPVAAPVAAGSTIPGDGTFVVGQDVAPGRYRVAVETSVCHWQRQVKVESADGTSQYLTVKNGTGRTFPIVVIRRTDTVFFSQGCGGWTLF